jgi:hypothetical protein
MAATVEAPATPITPIPAGTRPPGSLRFDWLMLLVGIWPVVGAEYDAYTHINTPNLESFFTPAHATLYSGVAAVGLVAALAVLRNHAQGYAWARAIPAGYGLTVLGVAILSVAGIGDLIWHSLFGIERDIPAIVSPTHILIVIGIVLIVTGPLRSAASRPRERVVGVAQLPLIVSLLFTYTMITIVLQYLNPLSYRWAEAGNRDLFADGLPPIDPYLADGLGLAGILLTTVILMAIVLPVVGRWQLLPGALTFILTLEAVLLATTQGISLDGYKMVPGVVAAGILGDLLLLALRPAERGTAALRVFAFGLPVIFFAAYFADLALVSRIAWISHLWAGSIFAAGVVGLALSLLMTPTPVQSDTR